MNHICHFEIGCRDQKRTSEFYESLFQWKMQPAENGTYVRTGADADIGGHINSLGHEPHNYTIFYVYVEDVAAALAKAESLGGKKLVGPIDIPPGGGTFAWFADPEGNTIGLYMDKKK
jgi:predicted enzyme related to lactoylglutathione lyase